MKKIEIYLTDKEYDNFVSKIPKFQEAIMNDESYSDEERTEIINSSCSLPFYIAKGVKKQLKEMDNYINGTKKETKVNNEIKQEEYKKLKTETEEIDIPQDIEYETETSEATDFDFNA